MRWLTALLLCLSSCGPAFAGVQFCNEFDHLVRFAIAYQTPDGWVSEGWVSVDPKACVTDTKHADLTNFLWTAETGEYRQDGKHMKTTWGSNGQAFSAKEGPFTLKNADRKLKGARLVGFNGPVSLAMSAIVATVEIEADGTSKTIDPGPNSVLKSDPDFKACEELSGDEAIAACDRAIASGKFKGNFLAELYNGRGVERKAKQDLDGALSDYNEALRLDAKNTPAYNNRGSLHLDKKEYDAAVKDYSSAIEINPSYVIAYMGRGEAYRETNDLDHAIDDYKKALSLNPSDERKKLIEKALSSVYVNRGVGQKNSNDELADYDEAIQLNPSNTAALNNRGAFYNNKGEYDRAIQDLDLGVKLKPDFSLAFRNRGDAYRGKGDPDHAVADYKQALSLNPSDDQKQKIQAALDAIASGLAAPAPSSATSAPTPALSDPAPAPGTPAPSGPGPASGSADHGQVDFQR
jgi:tetratricopeptide (TPR) repeat protein